MKPNFFDSSGLIDTLIETRTCCREWKLERTAGAIQTALHLVLIELSLQDGDLQWMNSSVKESILERSKLQSDLGRHNRFVKSEAIKRSSLRPLNASLKDDV